MSGMRSQRVLQACLLKLVPVVMQDWLYEEGEDETKSTYVAKLNELRQTGQPPHFLSVA